jgi:hypothetical protein
MDCREALASMAQDLAGGLPEPAHEALLAHVASCAPCRAEHEELRRAWATLEQGDPGDDSGRGAAAESPSTSEFAAAAISGLRAHVLVQQGRRRTRRLRQAVFAGAGAVLALAAGFALVIRGHARSEAVFAPVAARVAEAPAAGTPAVPGLAEMPAMSALPAPLAAFMANQLGSEGGRGQAIALVGTHFGTGQQPIPDGLIEALTRTLLVDRNPGVRKKAAQALLGLPPTAEIRAAFIQALRKEPNPAIRIIAVEALGRAARGYDPASIESLRERAGDQDESRNLRTRAARALQTLTLAL